MKTLIIFSVPFLIRTKVSLIRIGSIFYAMVGWVRFAIVVAWLPPLTMNQRGVACKCCIALYILAKQT